MSNDKDRKPENRQHDDRQDHNRNSGPAQQQAGQPGFDRSAEIQDRQNRNLHRDAAKEMHDQLTGESASGRQQQAGQDNREPNANRQDRDANRPERNAGNQQQAAQHDRHPDEHKQAQGKDAHRSGSNQQK